MKKLLSILGSVGMIGTAGATVVACGKKPAKEADPIEVAKGKLKTEIDKAQGLVNTSKKATNVTDALKVAIDKAQKVHDRTNVTAEDLKGALTELQEAISVFTKAEDQAPSVVLQNKIAEANDLVTKAEKEKAAVDTLKAAVTEAQKVLDNKQATKDQLTEATTKLQTAIETYKKADNKN